MTDAPQDNLIQETDADDDVGLEDNTDLVNDEEDELDQWAHSGAILTEVSIDERLAESKKRLNGIGEFNVRSFLQMWQWKLNRIMASQDWDLIEPDAEVIALEEKQQEKKDRERKERKKRLKVEKQISKKVPPKHVALEQEPEQEQEPPLAPANVPPEVTSDAILPSETTLIGGDGPVIHVNTQTAAERLDTMPPRRPHHVEQIGDLNVPVYKAPNKSENVNKAEKKGKHADEDDLDKEYGTFSKTHRKLVKTLVKDRREQITPLGEAHVIALALGNAEKKNRAVLLRELKETFEEYSRKRLCREEIELQDQPIALPEQWKSAIAEIELDPTERKALEYFAVHQAVFGGDDKYKGQVHVEELMYFLGSRELDQFECPLVIRSLEEKLAGTCIKPWPKTTHGDKHLLGGQGQRVNWIKLADDTKE